MVEKKDGIDKQKDAAMKNAQQARQLDKTPHSDIYSEVEHDPETMAEKPTEAAVEEAKEWVDDMNKR
ncbi:MAG: DUF3787 domain-containing protein [Tissierellia bacterium]|nr:DUF3787 domain-containing protein [Tissierellia bacterium]